MKALALSVVPSPYQRDLFRAAREVGGLDLHVQYLEAAAPDSPWARAPAADWERTLPGFALGRGRVRCHINSRLPDPRRFDVVLCNLPITALTAQRVMRHLLPRSQTPWVFWGETLLPRTGTLGVIQRALAAPIGGAAGILAIGARAAAGYRERFPGMPVESMPYFCDLGAFQNAARDAPPRPPGPGARLLFCGQMIARKGFDVLLRAWEQAAPLAPDAQLTLAGREAPEARAAIAALPPDARRRVRLAGFVQPEALPRLFADADVFVLPSRHDGWGVVVNQALGAGLPVIASDGVGAAADLVADRGNGRIVPAGDAAALAQAIAQLAGDPTQRARMAEASARRGADISLEAGARRLAMLLARFARPA